MSEELRKTPGIETGVEGVGTEPEVGRTCFHCGLPCGKTAVEGGEHWFCCSGCLTVHDVLRESGLGRFYDLQSHPGVRASGSRDSERWRFLDEPGVRDRLLDFTDGRLSRVTFQVPQVHCVACVWLLENLFQLRGGIGKSRVNFARREVSIDFQAEELRLSEVAALLASLGYEPSLKLSALERAKPDRIQRRQVLQTGIAGFAFGNIMLLSLPAYLGLDSLSGPLLQGVFGLLSLILAFPVLVFSASDYWKSAALSLRQRQLTLDVPIALGLAALYGQSAWEILSQTGEGYLDSLSGLVFFLLCGRWFQTKTYARMAFDRDYRSFFPLAVARRTPAGGEERAAVSSLQVGDRMVLRHGELVPADARLMSEGGLIDYSFVTGEAEPVQKCPGDVVYAGGRQMGGLIELETVKPVSQSYLTSLWEHQAFQEPDRDDLQSLTNRYSRWFTVVVVGIALGAGLGWMLTGDSARGLRAFVAVLIVACPCALALAAPFALGTAQRWLARAQVFLRKAEILERLAHIESLVFDKTGTLTVSHSVHPTFEGPLLSTKERGQLATLARQSSHPLARRLAQVLGAGAEPMSVNGFSEETGLGLAGRIGGVEWALGSRTFLQAKGVELADASTIEESVVHVAANGEYRGRYTMATKLRPGLETLMRELSATCQLSLVSGDHAGEMDRFRRVMGPGAALRFSQSPLQKLTVIQTLQEDGRRVAMVGDGLNDAGALRQSDVGIAVVESVGAFSPASDVILAGERVPDLGRLFTLARRAVRVVGFCLSVSALYNAVGISIAAAGWLSPVLCAVLMPISSVSVVLLACGLTTREARRLRLGFDLGQGGDGGGAEN
jgi:Cu+-exporting ATPase